MSNKIDKAELSRKIAYITINPSGNFLKSAQVGFEEVGLFPEHLIYIRPTDRLKKEFKTYKLSIITHFLLPKILRFMGNKKSFSNEVVNIPIKNSHTVSNLNSSETEELIKKLGIRYLINCGAGIFRDKIINIPNLYILNAHAGKLPEYKNMNVVEWAICNNDKVIATLHQIDKGIDTGPIWIEEEVNIDHCQTLLEARETAFDHVIRLAGKAVYEHASGNINPIPHRADTGKKWYKMHSYFQDLVNKKLGTTT